MYVQAPEQNEHLSWTVLPNKICFDANFLQRNKIRIRRTAHHVLDPLVRLPLRINEQGPPPRAGYQHGVFGWQIVPRQSVYLPASYLDRFAQRVYRIAVGCVGDVLFLDHLVPFIQQRPSVFVGERGEISDRPGAN